MEGKQEFLERFDEYVESLIGSSLTDRQLAKWIREDCSEWREDLTDRQIDWLVEAVREREAKTVTVEKVSRILMGSKEYEFNGSVLTVRDYYDRQNKFSIDISKLTQEMLEELKPDEDDEYEEW